MTSGLDSFTDRRNTARPPLTATAAKWTDEEKQRLLDLVASGLSRKKLCHSMPGRSPKAVEGMLLKLGHSAREQALRARQARATPQPAPRPKHQPQKQVTAPRPETPTSKATLDQRPARLTGIPFPDVARPRLLRAARSLRTDGPQPYGRLCSAHRLSWSDFVASAWFDVANGGLAYLTTAGEIALDLDAAPDPRRRQS